MTNSKLKFLASLPISTILWLIPFAFVSAQGTIRDVTWNSPLPVNTTAESLVTSILNAIITIAIPIVVVMIIYGGFQYVTARGNPEQITKATRTLTYAIIGGLLIIGSVALTAIIGQTVNEFRS